MARPIRPLSRRSSRILPSHIPRPGTVIIDRVSRPVQKNLANLGPEYMSLFSVGLP